MKNIVLSKLKQQLSNLSARMSNGGSLWGAPEGQLSPSGVIGPITSIPYRLLQAGPPDASVLPIFIIYDFMSMGRLRIFIDIAAPITEAQSLTAHELASGLRNAWLLSARFTCTQLASGFLVETSRSTNPAFTVDDLSNNLLRQAATLVGANRHVDQRLLLPRTARKLAGGYLKYASRHWLVCRDTGNGRGTWMPTIGDLLTHARPGEVEYRQFPLTYAWHELQDMQGVINHARTDHATTQSRPYTIEAAS